ncbi:hypothetical protein PCANC_00648 [Puccinia coronata f. sp. avenae]|uniref:Uncharacterized protein n=1 Tax=Puccinia coronata f. sp. avenae TaxID=200324 RepID=A0A2N5W788_9BASI|nr:hypothetical protein PCANC_00648 [Puccinia coronata f. sp. avenae]
MSLWECQDNSEIRDFITRSAGIRNRVSSLAEESGGLIDALIQWSTLSDLAILQVEWQKFRQESNEMLKTLSAVINGTYVPSDSLAQLAIPMVKLTRLLFTKLTNTATSQVPLT